MEHKLFEKLLTETCKSLTLTAQKEKISSKGLEDYVVATLSKNCPKYGFSSNQVSISSDYTSEQIFPDISIGEYGIEVKHTTGNKWRCIGNSINEGHRNKNVKFIYIIYGKMGGTPEVKWGRYEESVVHVRSSHRLRFEVEVPGKPEDNLFDKMGISYTDFSEIDYSEKMKYVRKYAKDQQMKNNRYIWWLDEPKTTSQMIKDLFFHLNIDDENIVINKNGIWKNYDKENSMMLLEKEGKNC